VVNEGDTCVYFRFAGGNGVIFGTSIDVINDVKSFLSQFFISSIWERKMLYKTKNNQG
jgi:hypothetical protein